MGCPNHSLLGRIGHLRSVASSHGVAVSSVIEMAGANRNGSPGTQGDPVRGTARGTSGRTGTVQIGTGSQVERSGVISGTVGLREPFAHAQFGEVSRAAEGERGAEIPTREIGVRAIPAAVHTRRCRRQTRTGTTQLSDSSVAADPRWTHSARAIGVGTHDFSKVGEIPGAQPRGSRHHARNRNCFDRPITLRSSTNTRISPVPSCSNCCGISWAGRRRLRGIRRAERRSLHGR